MSRFKSFRDTCINLDEVNNFYLHQINKTKFKIIINFRNNLILNIPIEENNKNDALIVFNELKYTLLDKNER